MLGYWNKIKIHSKSGPRGISADISLKNGF